MELYIYLNNLFCFNFYLLAEQKWTLIGDVVSNNDNVSTGKSMFDGKEYDYVFNIDIGDGIPALKLPFNNDQDPYTVAQVMQKSRRNRISYQT